jgi:hypothetical protein
MSNFDRRIKEILSEGIGSMLGSAMVAAEKPSAGAAQFDKWASSGSKVDKEKAVQATISKNNPPKPFRNTNKKYVVTTVNSEPVIGYMVGDFDNMGKFFVAMDANNPDGTPNKFCFVKTQLKPEWRIDYISNVQANLTKDPVVTAKNPKTGVDQAQICPANAIKGLTGIAAVPVGPTTKFINWYDLDSYLKTKQSVPMTKPKK